MHSGAKADSLWNSCLFVSLGSVFGIILSLIFINIGSMKIDDWIQSFSALGSLAAATIALITLKEMSLQRKLTHQPDIQIGKTSFKSHDREWIEKDSENDADSAQRRSRSFNIKIFNIGNGVAKSVQLSWEFDYPALIKQVCDLNAALSTEETITLTQNHLIFKNSSDKSLGLIVSLKSNEKNFIDFILPAAVSTEPVNSGVPYAFIALTTRYIDLYFQTDPSKFDDDNFPSIKLKAEYTNIDEDVFIKEFTFKISLHVWSASSAETPSHFRAAFVPTLIKELEL